MSDRLRIVRIVLEGVKAFDRDLTLSPLNLLLGEPGSGKSSVAEALRFAALGWVPALGGRESDTARILRGPRIVVRVELSDGRWFTRSLSRSGSGFRSEARTSWLPASASNTAHGGAIRDLFGQSDAEAAEHSDLRELLDATPAQRAERIDALLSATAAKPEEVGAHVEALTVARLAKLDEARIPGDAKARAGMVAGLVPTLDAGQADLLPTVRGLVLGALRGKGLQGAIDLANASKREAADAVRRRTAAQAELEDRDRAAAAPAATLADLNARRQAASDRLAVVRSDREREGQAQTAKASAEAAVAKAKAPTADHEAIRASIAEARADADRWDAQAAALVEPAEVPPPVLAPADAKAEKAAKAAEAKAAKLDAEAAAIEATPAPTVYAFEHVPSVDGPTDLLRQRREALEVAKADPWNEVLKLAGEIEAEEAGFERQIARLRELAHRYGWDFAKAEKAVAEAAEALRLSARARTDAEARNAEIHATNQANAKAHGEALARARQLRAEATAERNRARDLRAAAAKALADANRGAQEAYARLVADRAVEVDRVRHSRAALTDRARKAREDADADEKAIAAEAAALAEAQARLDGIGEVSPFDLGAADVEIAELSATITKLDETRRAVEGADARKRELADVVSKIAEAQAAARVWTETEWALLRVRELDLSARGEPILARMRKFLEAAGRPEVPYLRATKTATDFGWRRAGAELPVEALSGGETVIFTTALAAAVIGLRRPPIRCLIVEAAELGDAEHARAVLAGIYAVREDVDLAIVSTCADLDGPNGWRVFTFKGAGPVVETDRS